MIDNPDYKGEWNPSRLTTTGSNRLQGRQVRSTRRLTTRTTRRTRSCTSTHSTLGAIGFDLWQVKSGSIFDQRLRWRTTRPRPGPSADETFKKTVEGEKKMKEKQDEEDRKKAEEEEKKRKEEEEAKKKSEGGEAARRRTTAKLAIQKTSSRSIKNIAVSDNRAIDSPLCKLLCTASAKCFVKIG
uniref:Uncharacterized protein n=1 Tax=Macrostomum lignano TaxID=282301 RepID=A0A1I8JQC0_9PLAT